MSRIRGRELESETVSTRALRDDAVTKDKIGTHEVRYGKERWPGRRKVSQAHLAGDVVRLIEEKAGADVQAGGAPATVTLRATNVEIPQDGLFLPPVQFTEVVELGVSRQKSISLTLPTTSPVWPFGGTVQLYLDGRWEEHTKGGEIEVRMDGERVWPPAELAESPNLADPTVVGEYRSFGPVVSDGIPVKGGEEFTLYVHHGSGEPQMLAEVTLGIHQLETDPGHGLPSDPDLPSFNPETERVFLFASDAFANTFRARDGSGNDIAPRGIPWDRNRGQRVVVTPGSSAHLYAVGWDGSDHALWRLPTDAPPITENWEQVALLDWSPGTGTYVQLHWWGGLIVLFSDSPVADRRITAFDPDTGTIEWQQDLTTSHPWSSRLVVVGSTWRSLRSDALVGGTLGGGHGIVRTYSGSTGLSAQNGWAFMSGSRFAVTEWGSQGLVCLDAGGDLIEFGDLPFADWEHRIVRARGYIWGRYYKMEIATGKVSPVGWADDDDSVSGIWRFGHEGPPTGNAIIVPNESQTRLYQQHRTGSSPTFQHRTVCFDLATETQLWMTTGGAGTPDGIAGGSP